MRRGVNKDLDTVDCGETKDTGRLLYGIDDLLHLAY